jgi:MFS family permease
MFCVTTPFRAAFAVSEFRALFTAGWVSAVGDQCARVALAVLVYQRTASAGLTALTYALTFVPDLLGGPLLCWIADRYPRMRVMILADLLRAALVATMAVRGVPLWAVCALLVMVQFAGAPAGAARGALLAQVLPGEKYTAGQAANSIMVQAAQVVGFAGGGALVARLDVPGALLVDAATFLVSALIVALWVQPRPAPTVQEESGAWHQQLTAGTRLVWSDLRLRTLVAAACVSGFYIVGEALAAPYAAELGGGPLEVGLLFAAYPFGTVLGMVAIVRVPRRMQLKSMPALVVAACAPLLVCTINPGLVVTILLFTCSGAASAYHVVASTTFVRSVPEHQRGQAFGLAVTALRVSQGLGVIGAGLAAEYVAAGQVLAAAGALGVLAGCGVWVMWRRVESPVWD